MSDELRILVTAYDYRPRLGGIATLSYEATKAMAAISGVRMRVLAPDMASAEAVDKGLGFETRRLKMGPGVPRAVMAFRKAISEEILTLRPHAILDFIWIPDGISTYLCFGARRRFGVPYFVYAHSLEVMESSLSLKRRLRNLLSPLKYAVFRGAEGVFANSQFTRQLVSDKCRTPPDKIHVVHPGVDPKAFYPEPKASDLVEKYGLLGKKVFLTLTRLDDYKGIDHAIIALKPVIKIRPDIIYLICGEGKDRARLEALIKDHEMQANVMLIGAIPFERVRDYYNLCDVFMMLSREHIEPPDVEGFGIVFLEAAACGKPSLGGLSGGISDAVEDGRTGWLVSPIRDELITEKMLEIFENPAEISRRGQQALERVLTRFTWHHMALKFCEHIKASISLASD